MVDSVKTNGFAEYCRLLRDSAFDAQIAAQVREQQRAAEDYVRRLLEDAARFQAGFADLRALYSFEELQSFREGSGLPDSAAPEFLDIVVNGARMLFEREDVKMPQVEDLVNAYAFRLGVCAHLVQIDWLARGGAADARVEKLRNDIVDASIAACATYFDEFMTNDAKANRVYFEAMRVLEFLKAKPMQPVALPM